MFCGPQGVEQLRDQPWSPEVSLATHPLLGRPGLKAVSELTVLGALASRHVDLLHNVAMTGPLHTRATSVVMIHDVTWLIAPDPGDAITNTIWRVVVPRVARRADRVIALSRAAADDIARHLGVARSLIDVVPHGPGIAPPATATATEEAELRRRFGLDGPIILTVSAKRVHKNLVRLIEAMSEVAKRHPDAVLVMPGNPTSSSITSSCREDGMSPVSASISSRCGSITKRPSLPVSSARIARARCRKRVLFPLPVLAIANRLK